jgi:hypothetical protein
MPFTFAHPAVVVPIARLWRRWAVLPALVVGSMSPDFEYFIHLAPVRTIGHDLNGILLLDIPSGLLVLLVFEFVMKGPLIDLLPDAARSRLGSLRAPLDFQPLDRLALIVLSLAIGALSHIAWDGFTHGDGPFVTHIPFLASSLFDAGHGEVKIFKVLQHGSTLAGAGLLMWWSYVWLMRQPAEIRATTPCRGDLRRSTIIMVLMVLACFLGLALAFRSSAVGTAPSSGRIVVSTLSASFLVLLVYCTTATHLTRKTRISTM